MQGSAKRNLLLFKKLCGEDALKNVILATSMGDKIPLDEAQKREDQLKCTQEFWGWMLSKGSKTYRHNNTKESARDLLKHFLPMDKTTPALQDDMVNKKKTLAETGAGIELEDVLAKEREKFARELLEAQAQMREAIKRRDQESIEAIREMQEQYEAHMRRLEKDWQELKVSMEKLHQERYNQLEAKMLAQQRKLLQTQEGKQRMQEEKHRLEMEALRENHTQELARAEAEIAKLQVSQSRSPTPESAPRRIPVRRRWVGGSGLINNARPVANHLLSPNVAEPVSTLQRPHVDSDVTKNTESFRDLRRAPFKPTDVAVGGQSHKSLPTQVQAAEATVSISSSRRDLVRAKKMLAEQKPEGSSRVDSALRWAAENGHIHVICKSPPPRRQGRRKHNKGNTGLCERKKSEWIHSFDESR